MEFPLFEKVEIIDTGSEGKAVAKVNNMVIFVPFVVPGDIVDIQVVRKKKKFYEGRAVKIHTFSDQRTEPRCEHFGICGGCKWQNMDYSRQLYYKEKQVSENLQRIGGLELPEVSPILASDNIYYYRNKLEYTFSNRKWFVEKPDPNNPVPQNRNGLGFHLPGMFDRILDIENCYLQEDPSNAIRLAIRDYALEHAYEFYDVKTWDGYLRNLFIRNSSTGDIMIILVFRYVDHIKGPALMEYLAEKFPAITSLMYVINNKNNDDISDLEVQNFKGESHIMEEMGNLKFMIRPKSFFQTNPKQALKLYEVVKDFADLKGDETVYDLYTGTGTIACYMARSAKKVIGIEYVASAIEDAEENASRNGIENISFYAGDMLRILNNEFVEKNGKPDLIITDPPRPGMHERVVKQIAKIAPDKIIYVSCNPSTQARDLALLKDDYKIVKLQPVDMFPQTHHVENVALLIRR